MENTLPWASEEKVSVDSVKLAYHYIDDIMIVEFACGKTATVAELRASGSKIEMPKLIRRNNRRLKWLK